MSGGDQPLVSVLMPYYNGSGFMYEAIESVLNQTYKNIEIIVIDDASPRKKESEYIEDLSAKLGFKLIKHSVNKGICLSLVDGFKAADGEFIAELSQDDLYKPEKIERQLRELFEKDLDAVYAAGDILYYDSGKMVRPSTSETKSIINSGNAIERLRLQNLNCISIQGLLAKRSVFEEDIVPIWGEFMLDDWPVNIRLFEKYRVGFLEGPLWTSKVHSANTSFDIWKWFGPQIEVVSRMTKEHLKAEAIGRRIISMARRLSKQKADTCEIVYSVLAGLMLIDSQNERKRVCKILAGIISKDKKTIIDEKLKLIGNAMEFRSCSVPKVTGSNTMWDNFGRNIDKAVRSGGMERLGRIADEFCSLTNGLLQKDEYRMMTVRLSLAALMFADKADSQERAIRLLGTQRAEVKREFVEQKCRLIRSMRNLSLRHVIKNWFRAKT